MLRFCGEFHVLLAAFTVTQNILVFDVGANVGHKAARFVAQGARVICFEPVPECVKELRSRFEGNPSVTIAPCGLGSSLGTLPISVCSAETTISTFSDTWKHGRFSEYVWDKTVEVPVQTLDGAIAEFGLPDYCKIDVEGFELSVLRGLSRPIPVLSFEFCSEGLSQTAECLNYLQNLGYLRFNVGYGECTTMRHVAWLSASELMAELREHRCALVWGDIYAAQDEASSRAAESVLPQPPASEDFPSVESDTLAQLLWRGLVFPGMPVRLHLGSADKVQGYINIDDPARPPLTFQRCSVDEVRVSRHMFERLSRPTALRLLVRCELWLKPGSRLLVETRDKVHVVLRRKLRNLQSLLQCCVVALFSK
jgi:FkbM family methyltransferase